MTLYSALQVVLFEDNPYILASLRPFSYLKVKPAGVSCPHLFRNVMLKVVSLNSVIEYIYMSNRY